MVWLRDLCSACKVISSDLERVFATFNHTQESKRRSKQLPVLMEGVCDTLGYYHQPYIWLEDHCSEIVEDRASKWGVLERAKEVCVM